MAFRVFTVIQGALAHLLTRVSDQNTGEEAAEKSDHM